MLSLTDLRARVHPEAEAPAARPAPTVDPSAIWFTVQTNPRCEAKVMHNIAALGWPVFVPFGWKWSRPRHAPSGTHVVRRRPGMPGYVFFSSPRDERGDLRVSEVRGVDGVHHVVSQHRAPSRIRGSVLDMLQKAETAGVYNFNKEPPRGKLWDLQVGDKVRITSGIGEGWIGVVRCRSNAKEVEVIDVLFGMKLVVTLERVVPFELTP